MDDAHEIDKIGGLTQGLSGENTTRQHAAIAGLSVVIALGGLPLRAGDPPSPIAPHERLLVLPARFLQYKYSLTSRVEVIPDQTELGERNLESSLQRTWKRDQSQQFLELPELSAGEQEIVREHADLLRQVAVAAINIGAASPWRSDYSIGPGLAFLAERTGVDRAIFVSGGRADPSVGIALFTGAVLLLGDWPAVPGGNQKAISALVVELRSGDVLQAFMPERGLAGEATDIAGSNTWMRALFDLVPQPVRGELKRNRPPASGKQVRHPRPRRGFVVVRPAGWMTADSAHLLCFRRHSAALESICVDDKTLDEALQASGLKPDVDALRLGEIAVSVFKADPHYTDMKVETVTRARIAGREGFRAELTSRRNLGSSGIRGRHLVYGVVGPQGAYLLRFDAPAIYHFEHHRAEFEALVPTLKLM